jgi:tRNA pseudouridine38/39 synthase
MSNEKIKNSKRKLSDEDEEEKWKNLSREDIIQRCKQLEKHVEQLRNTISKTNEKESKKRSMRPFDFTKHPKRHIFLKFIYLGWEYHVR